MIRLLFLSCFLFLTSIKSEGQHRYLMVDRKLKKPLQIVDAITKEQMDKGFFVVEKQNVDTLIAKLQLIRSRLKEVARDKFDEVRWQVGATILSIRVVKWTFADRLNVAISTDTGNGHDRSFYIVDSRYTNDDNARYLKKLINYLEKR